MNRDQLSRRRWVWLFGGAGIACGALAWQAGWAQEPGRWIYAESSDYEQSGLAAFAPATPPPSLLQPRVPEPVQPQSVQPQHQRQRTRPGHRGMQVSDERFAVIANGNAGDAELAQAEFTAAWNEFSRLADSFTRVHRRDDFHVQSLVVVIDEQPQRELDKPTPRVQFDNDATYVYLNVSPEESPLAEQLSSLHQGAVEAFLHLTGLDRQLPRWVQQGLAEYTVERLEHARLARQAAWEAEEQEGLDPVIHDGYLDEFDTYDDPVAEEDEEIEEPTLADLRRGVNPGHDRWGDANEPKASAALERVRFFLEGQDGKYAPAFLLTLRQMAMTPLPQGLETRQFIEHLQSLPPEDDSLLDELVEDLDSEYQQWKADPLHGLPLFTPGGEIPDPAMLAHEKSMEVVLKLARIADRQQQRDVEIRPRITEFGPDGQREVEANDYVRQAMDIEQLYWKLTSGELGPWATLDAEGKLLLWTDAERLEEVLGVEEHRFTTAWREGHWVLATRWDETTDLHAWLEENPANPSRPLVRFAASSRESSESEEAVDPAGDPKVDRPGKDR